MPKQKPIFPEIAFDRTVQTFPSADGMSGRYSFTFSMASVADNMTAWGTNVARRDMELRKFWPTENMLAGAVSTVCSTRAAFNFALEGPDRVKDAVNFILHNAIVGSTRGWVPFVQAISQDAATQDNGFFIEIIRDGGDQTSPVVGIAHLDAGKCQRTGNPDFPVIYTDRNGQAHKMAWYQVIALAEFPSPIESMNGVGLCAESRVLRAAQIMKDLAIFKHEKVSGRFERTIHFVGGVSAAEIEDKTRLEEEKADNQGLTRFKLPMIVTSLDPEKPVTHVEIPLASLPDGFDYDQELKWYITELALGFGVDYQDFAPLPGGNLGTSTQSEILHRKSRGKGPALFMATMQNIFKWYGVVPQNVVFKFAEQDLAFEQDRATLAEIRARTRSIQIRSGEITTAIARQLAIKAEDLEPEHLALLTVEPGEEENAANLTEQGEIGVGLDEDMEGGDTLPDKMAPIVNPRQVGSRAKSILSRLTGGKK